MKLIERDVTGYIVGSYTGRFHGFFPQNGNAVSALEIGLFNSNDELLAISTTTAYKRANNSALITWSITPVDRS